MQPTTWVGVPVLPQRLPPLVLNAGLISRTLAASPRRLPPWLVVVRLRIPKKGEIHCKGGDTLPPWLVLVGWFDPASRASIPKVAPWCWTVFQHCPERLPRGWCWFDPRQVFQPPRRFQYPRRVNRSPLVVGAGWKGSNIPERWQHPQSVPASPAPLQHSPEGGRSPAASITPPCVPLRVANVWQQGRAKGGEG